MSPVIVEPCERGANGGECLERVHEQHRRHHDAEDLQGVAGHVHHNCVHGDGFRRGDGNFPGLFEEEVIGFDGGRGEVRFAAGFLGEGSGQLCEGEGGGTTGGNGGLTFPPPLPPWEKPGGSGMEGDGLGRDMGRVLKSMTQAGEGGGGMRGGPWGAMDR